MKVLSRLFDVFAKPTKQSRDIYNEWDRQRARAMSPSELSEIDAIFSRAV